MAGRKVEIWSRIIETVKRLSQKTGIELPKDLGVQSGDFFTRNMKRLEIVADFLEQVEAQIGDGGKKPRPERVEGVAKAETKTADKPKVPATTFRPAVEAEEKPQETKVEGGAPLHEPKA